MVSRERVLLMQQNATVLVNPRTSEGDFTKYSFPSKIMEYFASGTPTIMHRLPGIPEEYYSYCFVVDPADAESLFKTMVKVCGMNQMELNEIGRKAQNFIFEQKNPKKQAGKIFEMISKL
jgi:glycosyltransferase involved in cell wall biosynthesis